MGEMRVFVSHTFADKGFCDTLAPNVAVMWRNKAAALRAVGRAAEAAQAEAQARALDG